jgi:hypothetical protein
MYALRACCCFAAYRSRRGPRPPNKSRCTHTEVPVGAHDLPHSGHEVGAAVEVAHVQAEVAGVVAHAAAEARGKCAWAGSGRDWLGLRWLGRDRSRLEPVPRYAWTCEPLHHGTLQLAITCGVGQGCLARVFTCSGCWRSRRRGRPARTPRCPGGCPRGSWSRRTASTHRPRPRSQPDAGWRPRGRRRGRRLAPCGTRWRAGATRSGRKGRPARGERR